MRKVSPRVMDPDDPVASGIEAELSKSPRSRTPSKILQLAASKRSGSSKFGKLDEDKQEVDELFSSGKAASDVDVTLSEEANEDDVVNLHVSSNEKDLLQVQKQKTALRKLADKLGLSPKSRVAQERNEKDASYTNKNSAKSVGGIKVKASKSTNESANSDVTI